MQHKRRAERLTWEEKELYRQHKKNVRFILINNNNCICCLYIYSHSSNEIDNFINCIAILFIYIVCII